MGNVHVKLYEIRTGGSGGDVVERKSLRTDDDARTRDGRGTTTDHNSSP